MSGFTKLHATILNSSIWNEADNTRIVWITMLAMSDASGFVESSLSGLAHQARKSREDTEKALAVLSAPDADSKNPDHEGRRVAKVEAGWMVLNYPLYRAEVEIADDAHHAALRARVNRHREKKRKEREALHPVTPRYTPVSPASASASASESAGNGSAEGKGGDVVSRDDWIERIRTAYPRHGAQQDCRHAIRAALDAAHQTPEEILADVQACAGWVREAETNGTCSWVPSAEAFFGKRQWTDPKKFEGIALRVKEAQNGAKAHQRRDSGSLNAPGRYK